MDTSSKEYPHSQSRHDDEINLAELINTLLERKWLIFGGAFICSFIVGLYLVSKPKQYQSEALVLVSSSILKPNSGNVEGPQVSEITVSSLEASTYEVLAKSDELLLALADTLKARLEPSLLKKISEKSDTYSIATDLNEQLEVDLLQNTGLRNVLSTTPLLVLRYKSTEETLPPTVVNIWSNLFLERNQGLSSNVTDDFYQNAVRQYEQAKANLELKENELSQLDAASNQLQFLKGEMKVKSTQLDTSLKVYQKLSTDLAQKKRDYKYLLSALKEREVGDFWIGFSNIDSLGKIRNNFTSSGKDLIDLMTQIENLSRDSTAAHLEYMEQTSKLLSKHQLIRLEFEEETKIAVKKIEVIIVDSLIREQRSELASLNEKINHSGLSQSAILKALKEHKPVLTTRKAIMDEVLWDKTSLDGTIETEIQNSLEKYKLGSEEVNPVNVTLNDSLAHIASKYYFLTERRNFLKKNISHLQKQSKALHHEISKLREREFELESKLKSEFTDMQLGMGRLVESKNIQLTLKQSTFAAYKKSYEDLKKKLEALRREIKELEESTVYYSENYTSWRNDFAILFAKVDSIEVERKRIERDVVVYQESFNRFAKLREEARIARQQAAGDIQVVSIGLIAKRLSSGAMKFAIITGVLFLVCSSFITILLRWYNNDKKSL